MLGGWGCVAGCKQTFHHPCGYTQTPLAASLFAVRSPGNPKIRIETEGQNIWTLFEPGAGRKGLWEVPACGPEIMGGVKNKQKTQRILARVFLSYLHYRKPLKTSASSSHFILLNFLKKPKIKMCKDT